MEFIVPIHPEDLELGKNDRFCVQTVVEIEDGTTDVDGMLDDLTERLMDDNGRIQDAILSHEVFDNLYSLVKAWSILGASAKQRIMELFCSSTQELLAVVSGAGQQQPQVYADPRDAARAASKQRSAFKALSYMFAVTVQVAEKTYAPKQEPLGGGAKGKGKKGAKGKGGKKGKKATAAAAEEEGKDGAADDDGGAGNGEEGAAAGGEEEAQPQEDAGWDWPSLREQAVSLLTSCLASDFRRMWPLGLPEEEYVAVFVKTGARLMQSPAAMKDKGSRAATVELVAVAAARFPSVITSTVVAVVAMITTHEHAAAVATDLVVAWGTGPTPAALQQQPGLLSQHHQQQRLPTGCPAAAAEVLRELARINASGDSKDSAGLRRAAGFVIDVSDRLPGLVLSNVSVLLPFLDAEAHTLRSAVVTSLGNIVGRVFNAARMAAQQQQQAQLAAQGGEGAALDPSSSAAAAAAAAAANSLMSSRTRDTLLDVMLERSLDVHALTRAAVLRAWVALVQAAAVPPERLQAVTGMAVARLRDKGALVRKAAVQLLRALLEYNPFGGRIEPGLFQQHVSLAEEWLAQNAPGVLERLTGSGVNDSAASSGDSAGAGAGSKKPQQMKQGKRGLKAAAEADVEEDAEDGDYDDGAVAELDVNEELIADAAEKQDSDSSSSVVEVVVTPEAAAYVEHRSRALAGLAFAQQLAGAVPGLEAMMGSKVGSDVMEAIRFLSRARMFGVPGAEGGLARMLTLVWSSETSVREEVVTTFDKLFILNEALEEGDDDAEGAEGEAGAGFGQAAKPAAAAAAEEEEAAPAAPAARPKRASASAKANGGKRAASKGRGGKKKTDDDDEEEDEDDVELEEVAVSDDDGDAAGDDDDDDDEEAGPKRKRKATGASSKRKPAAPKGKSRVASSKAADAAKRAAVDPSQVASSLVALLSGASLAVRTSLEEVLMETVKRGLLPASVTGALWEMVGSGQSVLAAARLRTAKALAGVAKAVTSAAGGPSDAAAVASARTQARNQVTSLVDPVELALVRARNAMAILAMIGAASAKTGVVASTSSTALDSPESLKRLTSLLSPPLVAGMPQGLALLRAGQAALGLTSQAQLAILDHAVAAGDYRLARHACVALQKLAGDAKKHPAAVAAAAAAAAASSGGEKAEAKGKAASGRARATTTKAKAAAAAAAATDGEDESSSSAETSRSALLSRIVTSAACMVRGDWDGGDIECAHWYGAAQQAIDCVFALAPRPGAIFLDVLRHMAAGCFIVTSNGGATTALSPTISRTRLSRLFFVLGHVAMKLLLAAEALAVKVKALRVKASEAAAAGGGAATAPVSAPAAAAAEPAGKGKKGKAAAAAAPAGGTGLEEALGGAAAEDEKEAELVSAIGERELVSSTASSLGSLFAPLIVQVVTRQLSVAGSSGNDVSAAANSGDALSQSALLALCKLMAISPDFCEAHLQLLMTVLSAARSPPLRATIAVALGDLAFRFPNLVEPYTGYLYARLRDPDAGVRKNTLMVLTHLILNDMVKVKGQVGEIAICLNDPEPRVADLTRLFFTELSQRGNNPIYNILPDTLSCLSKLAREAADGMGPAAGGNVVVGGAPASSVVRPFDAATFRETVRFLLSFINKDKHAESLADKLLHRFETTGDDDVHLWRDVAFCLAQLPLNEKMIRRMAEGVRAYKRCLGDPDVWDSVSGMLAKAKRAVGTGSGGPAKAELKGIVDEWERQLAELHSGQVEDDSTAVKARAAARKACRVAAAEGIDAEAIASAAAAAAAASVADAAAAAAAAAKPGRGRKAASPGPSSSSSAAAAAKPKPKPKKKKKAGSDDDDDDDGDQLGDDNHRDDDEEEEAVAAPSKRSGKAGIAASSSSASSSSTSAGGKPPVAPPKRGLKKAAVVKSDDDEEEEAAPAPSKRKAAAAAAPASASSSRRASLSSVGSAAVGPGGGGGGGKGLKPAASAGVGPRAKK